jgi:hypothetical protein
MTKIKKRPEHTGYRDFLGHVTALNELSSPIYIGYSVSNGKKTDISRFCHHSFFLELRCQWWWIYTINLNRSVFTVYLKFYFIFFFHFTIWRSVTLTGCVGRKYCSKCVTLSKKIKKQIKKINGLLEHRSHHFRPSDACYSKQVSSYCY